MILTLYVFFLSFTVYLIYTDTIILITACMSRYNCHATEQELSVKALPRRSFSFYFSHLFKIQGFEVDGFCSKRRKTAIWKKGENDGGEDKEKDNKTDRRRRKKNVGRSKKTRKKEEKTEK